MRERRGRTARVVLLLLMLSVAAFTRFVPPHLLRDLHPWPDAVEYVLGARNLTEHGRFVVSINGEEVPSRYSPGFPLLVAGVFAGLGSDEYGNAILLVFVLHLLSVALVFDLGRSVFGWPAGLLAASFMILSPLDRLLSTVIMSEVAATAFVLTAVLMLTRAASGLGTPRGLFGILPLIAAGAAVSYSGWIRQANGAYLLPFGLFIALSWWNPGDRFGSSLLRAGRAVAIFGLSWLAVQLPVLLFNWRTFGSPLRTGYNLWLPGVHDHLETLFSVRNATAPPGQALIYLQAIVGVPGREPMGSILRDAAVPIALYPAFVPLLALVALIFAVAHRPVDESLSPLAAEVPPRSHRRISLEVRFVVLAVGIVATTYVVYSTYFFYSLRFFHTCVPFVAVLAAGGVVALVRSAEQRWKRPGARFLKPAAVLAVAGLAAGPLGAAVSESALWRTTVSNQDLYSAAAFEQMQLIAERTEDDAIVVGAWAPVFFSAYQQGTRRQFVTLNDGEVLPPHIRVLAIGRQPEMIAALLEDPRPLYYTGEPERIAELAAAAGVQLEQVGMRTLPNGYTVALYRVTPSAVVARAG